MLMSITLLGIAGIDQLPPTKFQLGWTPGHAITYLANDLAGRMRQSQPLTSKGGRLHLAAHYTDWV